MRIILPPVLGLFLCLSGPAVAFAADASEFSGTPVFSSYGEMMIDGRDVTLWGIDRLTGDQQCWHEDRAWNCGEQSLMALQHHLEDRPVRCAVKSDESNGKVTAQCFSKAGNKEEDIAHYLVIEGWARDQADVTNGLYAEDQDLARRNRRGIWTSRFQTAEDWKSGVPNYVQYEMAPLKTTTAFSAHTPGGKDKPQ